MLKLETPNTINRHIKRHQQVVQILVKHGFGQLLDQMKLWETSHFKRRDGKHEKEPAHLNRAVRVRLAMEELGPTYVKLGQALSTRPDMIPPEFITELEKLQDHVDPFPDEIARHVIEAELKRPLNDVFSSFGKKPVAAASLSQVYRAVLKDGRVVAVKVQRPGIEEIVQIDMEIIHDLAGRLERHFKEVRDIDLVSLLEEFSADMKRQMNFASEANNLARFAQIFNNTPYVHVPVVYREFCTARLLVMEFIEGINVSKIDTLKAKGYDLSQIAHNGVDLYLKSILEDGFFHADPHPGNILVLPDNVLCLLDFGMMGRLSQHDREILVGMMVSLIESDAKRMTEQILELAGLQAEVNTQQLEMEISGLIEDYAYLSIDKLNFGDLTEQIMRVLRNYHLHVPRHYVWLARVVSMVENLARQLDPEFNLAKYSGPYIQKLRVQQLNPIHHVRELRSGAAEFFKMAKDLPFEINAMMKQVKAGQLKVQTEHLGVESFGLTLNRIFNRVVVAIIVAAMLIGSAIVVHSGLPPLVSGIPVMGLAGFTIATLLGIWVIVSVLRNGIS